MAILRPSYLFYGFMLLSIGQCFHKPQDKNRPPSASNPQIDPEVKNIYQAAVQVTPNDQWLQPLGIDPKGGEAVVVNASNEDISFGGGGLNGALVAYASNKGQKAWQDLQLPNGSCFTPGKEQAQAGTYVISTIGFGKLYHAVGPRAANTTSLATASDMVRDLYDNMLTQAHQDQVIKTIVLPAIATGIFAGDRKGVFTKQDFMDTVYQGMKAGIHAFSKKFPDHSLTIILNGWDKKYVTSIPALKITSPS